MSRSESSPCTRPTPPAAETSAAVFSAESASRERGAAGYAAAMAAAAAGGGGAGTAHGGTGKEWACVNVTGASLRVLPAPCPELAG